MDLSTIKNTANWGSSAANLNENFTKVGTEVDKLKYAAYNSKLYATEALLKQSVPSPKVGDWAIVGDTIPGEIYQCKTDGVWTATGQTGGGYGMEVVEKNVTEQHITEVHNEYTGDIVNNPDDEDLYSEEVSEGKSVLKLADKVYNASSFSGMGRAYLRKNITGGKNVLTQAMMDKANTRYVIQYDYDLDGGTVTVPEGCTLDFQGGSFRNGTISSTFNIINTDNHKIFDKIIFENIQPRLYPEWFGARHNGIEDDTYSVQSAINYSRNCFFSDRSEYLVTKTISIPQNHSIIGNGAKIKIDSTFEGNDYNNDVPDETILYLNTSDGTVSGFDKAMRGAVIKDLRIFGTSLATGLYIGYTNKNAINSPSNVNYSIYGYVIENLYIDGCDVGILLTDCWDTNFNSLNVNDNVSSAVKIAGQVVNCTFNQCKLYGGEKVLSIGGGKYGSSNTIRRPEGCSFNGGFIGNGGIGLYEINSLAFYFNNLIIDLNSSYAIDVTDATNMVFNACWIYSQGVNPTIKIEPISTQNNNTSLSIKGSYITRNSSGVNIDIGYYRNGISISNNIFSQHPITASIDSFLVIENNFWIGQDTTANLITIGDNTIVRASANVFKITGNNIHTNIPSNRNMAGSDLPIVNSQKSGTASPKMLSENSKVLIDIPNQSANKYYDLFEITDTYHASVFLSMGLLAHDFLNAILRCSNNIGNVIADGINASFPHKDFTLHYYNDANNHIHVVYHPVSLGNHGVYGRLLANGYSTTIFFTNKDISDAVSSGEIELVDIDVKRLDGTEYTVG